MENEYNLDELLLRFLSNETTPEEERKVLSWVNACADNQLYLERLQTAWDLVSVKQKMSQIDTESAWTRFKKMAVIRNEVLVNEKVSYDELYESGSGSGAPRGIIYKLMIAAAVAACLFIFFDNSFFTSTQKQKTLSSIPAGYTQSKSSAIVLRHERNYSGKVRELVLGDGSSILLFDKSELKFKEPFSGNKRELKLTGKAEFRVAKDPDNPFIVYSNDISTTALGTQFSVSNFSGAQMITVQLFEGRILVESINEAKKKLRRRYYLNPGQELRYNQRDVTAKVKSFIKKNSTQSVTRITQKSSSADNPSIPKNIKGTWYMFNNQSLPDVFERLENMYGVDIQFSKVELQNLYFIGQFEKSDSLDKIVRLIAEVNNLKVKKQNSAYIIQK